MMTGRRSRDLFCLCYGWAMVALLTCVMSGAAADRAPPGKLYLVGIGPGDAELVTLKAARILGKADCVFCFPYLKNEVTRYARPEIVSVASPLLMGKFVGKAAAVLPPELREKMSASQAEMARFVPRVRQLVAAGKTVAFADAGDPTLFCPWTWIRETFADLSPEVVPGLSSFNAANAAVEPTMTCCGGAMLLSSGDNLGSPDERGRLQTTLVIFTHRMKVQDLVPRLAARYPGDTPIALVCEASYPTQRTIVGTLATIQDKLRTTTLPHLYLIYVGDKVGQRR
jgi:precorrin-4/cobalt-precorrin-4 C11-methyltransferase